MLKFAPMDTSLCALPPSSATLNPITHPFITSPLELSEPFFCSNPSLSSLDFSAASSSAPASKKRKCTPDFTYPDQLVLSHSGWTLLSDIHSFPPPWSNEEYSLMKASHMSHRHEDADDHVTHNCNDLDDILNFLWMDDDTASTAQSDASPHAPNSNGLVQVGTFSKQEDEKCHPTLEASWQKEEGLLIKSTSSWQVENGGQQGLLQDGTRVRASWQDGMSTTSWQDGIRPSWQENRAKASWQGREAKTSWQSRPAQGEARANWQQVLTDRVTSSSGGAERRSGVASSGSTTAGWAGPTLMDIESALALTDNSMSGPPTPAATSKQIITTPCITPFVDVKALLSQADPPQYQDSQSCSWRLKLQKRGGQEPKYTVKVESEEKALGDGYRWRKYGQKSIKNSRFPRSYYRCSSGKCSAKKQVEKCQVEEGIFLVTYEGIHLHHKPNMLHKLRILGDGLEDDKEKCTSCETGKIPSSPSSSTSCSHSIPLDN